MAKAPVLKTGGRKPLQVRILCPPFPRKHKGEACRHAPPQVLPAYPSLRLRLAYWQTGAPSGDAAEAGAVGVTAPM